MKVVDYLKTKIGYFILCQKLKNKVRGTVFNNFDSAKTAGIVFSAVDNFQQNEAFKFINLLRNKKIEVKGLGFVPDKTALEETKTSEIVSYFAISDNNWYEKPKALEVKEFSEMDFDVLIDLSLEDTMPLKYIIGMSNAKLKLGQGSQNGLPLYDVTIDVGQEKSISYFIEQILHYMSVMQATSTN